MIKIIKMITKKMSGIMAGVLIIPPIKKIRKMMTGITVGEQIQTPKKMITISNQNQYREMTSKKVL